MHPYLFFTGMTKVFYMVEMLSACSSESLAACQLRSTTIIILFHDEMMGDMI